MQRRPMKGIVFNLLEDVVCTAHGHDVWDELLDQAELDGVHVAGQATTMRRWTRGGCRDCAVALRR